MLAVLDLRLVFPLRLLYTIMGTIVACAHSFNKYISIAGRATVQALKEEPRVAAERRITEMGLR